MLANWWLRQLYLSEPMLVASRTSVYGHADATENGLLDFDHGAAGQGAAQISPE